MKLRITPLNIVQAITVAAMIYLIFAQNKVGRSEEISIGFYFLILICLMFVTIITDILFRIILKNTKRIWIIESIFIVITIILMVILQKVA
jgi:hypothetical protein